MSAFRTSTHITLKVNQHIYVLQRNEHIYVLQHIYV